MLSKHIQQINHRLRKSLELTIEEYCVLIYIYDSFRKKQPDTLEFTREFSEKLEKTISINYEDQIRIFKGLMSKGFLTQIANRTLRREKSSIFPFEPSEDKFEEWWELFKRNGNKIQAKKQYTLTMRNETHEFIMERTKLYLEHIEVMGYNQLHGSTFLNPQYKRYMDEFKSKNKNAPGGVLKGSFFD